MGLSAARSAINATPDLTRAERGGAEAKHGELGRDALEDGRVLFALRLELRVTRADELVDVQAQHVEHLVHGARRLLLGETE